MKKDDLSLPHHRFTFLNTNRQDINFYVDGSLVKTASLLFKNSNHIFANAKTNSNKPAAQKPARRKPAVI